LPEQFPKPQSRGAQVDLQRHPLCLALPTGQLACAELSPSGRQQLILVFLRRIYEHQACDFVRILSVEDADVVAAERMAHQNEWWVLASILQKRVEFAGNLRTRARQRTGIALAVAGAIVGAN